MYKYSTLKLYVNQVIIETYFFDATITKTRQHPCTVCTYAGYKMGVTFLVIMINYFSVSFDYKCTI